MFLFSFFLFPVAFLVAHCDRNLQYNKEPQFCLKESEGRILGEMSRNEENREMEIPSQHINPLQLLYVLLTMPVWRSLHRSHETARAIRLQRELSKDFRHCLKRKSWINPGKLTNRAKTNIHHGTTEPAPSLSIGYFLHSKVITINQKKKNSS